VRTWGRWWRTRSKPQRYDLLTRATMYTVPAMAPLLLVGLTAGMPGPVRAAVLTLGVAQSGICLLTTRAGIAHYLGRRSRPTALLAGCAVLAVPVVAVEALSAAGSGRPLTGPDGHSMDVALFANTVLVAALCVVLRPRLALLGAAVAATGPIAVGLADRAPAGVLWGTGTALSAAFVALLFSIRCSLWMLGVVWELDRTRRAQAQLAVAEERLRFARDLHDVLGRNLSVVALKSDLAAQLARRGRAEAVDEMLEVRRIAQDSLAEVREVVRGYRTADLAAELAGARALLSSAGVRCQVLGEDHGLPARAQDALGWVVREGITNVLRHSEASRCTITVRRFRPADPAPGDGAAERVLLTMENDGVPAGEPAGLGNGLLGLRERLAALGGTVTAARVGGDRFRLAGELPLAEPRPSVRRRTPAGDPELDGARERAAAGPAAGVGVPDGVAG
jgi:two-component system sensor histidine kinase DesK